MIVYAPILRIILAAAALSSLACAQPKTPAKGNEVDQAFEAMRAGRGTGFEKVLSMGDAAVPATARYLKDRDSSMRSQAVAVLASMGTPAACEAMVPGLEDASPDNRDRTAAALYRKCLNHPPASAARPLRALLRQGTSEAAAFLLLGHFPGAESDAALDIASKQRKPVRLEGGLPVPAAIAIAVASGKELGPLVRTEALPERLFLLSALPMIRAPKDLSNMAAGYLDDIREIEDTGMPSGAGTKRRLCDAALEALAKRADWKPPFELDGIRRYSDEERRQAKAALFPR